jgi:pimeloyl-ACP methyl ester carboxylesterase
MVHFGSLTPVSPEAGVDSVERQKVFFASGGARCAAWLYPGSNGGCVVMAGGLAVTKEPGTDRFAQRFNTAGFTVLAFDYRRLGESGGQPRQVVRINEQLADWDAAIACAASLPDVDAARIAVWGFSVSGGHVFRVAARNAQVCAGIAQTPNADGPAATRNALRYQTAGAALRLMSRGLLDSLGGVVGRPPRVVPLGGTPGTVALLTTPEAAETDRALNPDGRYPDWRQAIAARSTPALGLYRPGADAARVPCPLLVVVAEDDQSALAEPAVRAARRAPHGELVQVRGGHYAPFLRAHDEVVAAELAFLRAHLVPPPSAGSSNKVTARAADG